MRRKYIAISTGRAHIRGAQFIILFSLGYIFSLVGEEGGAPPRAASPQILLKTYTHTFLPKRSVIRLIYVRVFVLVS